MRPTYLTDYEMAREPAFQDLGRAVLARQQGEIGMHLHAWNTPPLVALTRDDYRFQPYLIEYPEPLQRAKVALLTDLLEETFNQRMLSHRSGRWGFDAQYARLLVGRGYRVDCSVLPRMSLRHILGDPAGRGGGDYLHFPEQAYFLDLTDIARVGASPLLEVPVTVVTACGPLLAWLYAHTTYYSPLWRALYHVRPPMTPLHVSRTPRPSLLTTVEHALAEQRDFLQLTLHSTEVMPGGSPFFPTADSIERLYDELEAVFTLVTRTHQPMTLAEFYQHAMTLPQSPNESSVESPKTLESD